MDKDEVVHIHNGILLNHEKEWNNAICSYTDGPRDYHTKGSKSDRERQIPHCGGGGGGMEWEVGVSRWKLLHVEGINNTVLLYIEQGTIFNMLW